MANFCLQCTTDLFGEEYAKKNDFVGVSSPSDTEMGLYVTVLCEGCGPCQVDHTGRCVSKDCHERHGEKENK